MNSKAAEAEFLTIGSIEGESIVKAQERMAPVLPFLTSFVPFVSFVVIYSSGYRILREGYLEQ